MDDPPTMLQFDWESVNGAEITAVLARGPISMNDGSLACDELALALGAKAVIMRVNDDTDEVIVTLEAAPLVSHAWQIVAQLAEMKSRRLTWCWIGRNYLGYLDTFMIAIDGIDPTFSFTGAASRIHCARLTPIMA